MPDHGKLFDQFSARASHAHGGSYFDAGFGHRTLADAHGKLYDLFGVPRDSDAHGPLFDDFGWKTMPVAHGAQFDSDFRSDTADTGDHGTWFDVFRGGTEVKFILDGADYEGTVIDCHRDHANVRGHDGQIHEIGLSQFLAYRTPNQAQAGPTMPASDATAPSAHSPDAHGAFHGDRSPVTTDMPPVVQEVPQGQHAEPRAGLPAGLMDTFTRLKSMADDLDVVKDVDTTATAIQAKDGAKTVGHRANCPQGGSGPCGADVDGHCTSCGTTVHDHEAVGKSAPAIQSSTGDLGINVPERDHKTSDHHMRLGAGQPGRCPHCGAVLDELDAKADQGTPSRKDKQGASETFATVTHKCTGTALDVLKTLVEA